MGGSLAVSIRDPEGTWYKMDRWTNPTSEVFNDRRFLEGDCNIIKEYLQTWHDMCDEYDEWIAAGKDPDKMTGMAPVYCNMDYSSRNMMAPSEYGLVVIDFVEKRFWESQYYTTYGNLPVIHIQHHSFNPKYKKWLELNSTRVTGIHDLTDEGWTNKTPDWETTPLTFENADQWIAHAKQLDRRNFGYYQMDMIGWDFRSYGDDAEDWGKFRDELDSTYGLQDIERNRFMDRIQRSEE